MNGSGVARRSLTYRVKWQTVRWALLVLGTMFEKTARRCPELQAEIADWEEGRTISMGVLPRGPYISLRKEAGLIRYLGQGLRNADLEIFFKNLDCAILPLTAQIGNDAAFNQHRAIAYGDIGHAIQAARALQIVQTYLLPGFLLRRHLKRAPQLTGKQKWLKARLQAALGLSVLANMLK
ncbi:MAG: hypothetical protein QG656_2455 [Candidatus Hydrogenedentes bacterium]|nr:hypothetical protein [Candidatus Hydrogenedentota bacterium]